LGIAVPLSLYREKKIAKLEAEDQSEKFINFQFNEIQKLKIINKQGEVELVRRKKDATGTYEDEFNSRDFEFKNKPEWLVVKPYRAIADSMVVDSLYDQIKDIRFERMILETKTNLKNYELEPPVLSIEFFKDDSQEPTLKLDIGGENNEATSFYYAASDKPGVYLAERALQPFKEQPAQEWREKRILGFESVQDLEKISVRHSSNRDLSFEATKDKADWKIGAVSDNLAGDAAAIHEFLLHIDGIRSDQILDDVSIVKNLKPLGDVSLKIKNKKDPIVYYVYAGAKGSEMNYYIQRSDLKSLFTISEDPQVLPTFQEVVSKKLLNKSFTNMTSVKITRSGKDLTEIVREKDAWMIKKPVNDTANVRRLESVIQVISEIKPLLYLKNKTLNASDEKIKFEIGLDNQSTNTLTFYQQGKEFFARIEDENKTRVVSLYQIPSEIYEHLSRMRNTDLVPVAKDQVKRVIFTRGNSKVEIAKGAKRQGWYLNALENVSASVNMKWKDEIIPEEFFNRVSEMYLVDFTNEANTTQNYSTASLEIFTADAQYTWQFGEQKGELISVYSPDRKVWGTLPSSKYKDLSTMLDEPSKK
jgi:hypothetical protein